MTPLISKEVLADYLKCPYKAYLKLKGRTGQKTEYEELQNRLLHEYRTKALEHLLSSKYQNEAFPSKITLSSLREQPCRIATNVMATPHQLSVFFDDVIFILSSKPPQYVPVSFVHGNSVRKDNKLVLAFCGLLLGKELGINSIV